MTDSVKEKLEILKQNGCSLIKNDTLPERCKDKIEIRCSCGHNRISSLTNIINHKQYKCSVCIRHKQTRNFKLNKNKLNSNFSKKRMKFENKYIKSIKYSSDFSPDNINKKLCCRVCNIQKPLYMFYNRSAFMNNKEKLCKKCENESKMKRRMAHSKSQVISTRINAAKNKALQRKANGRDQCGVFEIDLDYILRILGKQQNRCVYSNKELSFSYNNRDGISIDRIDSNQGYIRGNIQILSAHVNWMKLDHDENVFFELISKIYLHSFCLKDYQNKDECTHKNINSKMMKHITIMLKTAKSSAKKRRLERGRYECGEYDITPSYIIKLIQSQDNRCLLSGIEFEWEYGKNLPFQPSIDRIDSTKGYIKGNIQILCNCINQMKSNLTQSQFLSYVNDIYNHKIA